MLSCGYEHTGGDPDDEAGGKDKNWSEGTVKRFPGMMAAVTRVLPPNMCPSQPYPRHYVVDELPAPHTSQKLQCRHRCDAARAQSVPTTDI